MFAKPPWNLPGLPNVHAPDFWKKWKKKIRPKSRKPKVKRRKTIIPKSNINKKKRKR